LKYESCAPQPQWGLLLREREGTGVGLLLRGTEGRKGRRERTEMEGKEIPLPEIKMSRLNTGEDNQRTARGRKLPKIIINKAINLISNHNSVRVLLDEIAFVYII